MDNCKENEIRGTKTYGITVLYASIQAICMIKIKPQDHGAQN